MRSSSPTNHIYRHLFALLLCFLAPLTAFASAEFELKIRPLVRSMALEVSFRMPTMNAANYIVMDQDEAQHVEQMRLELARDLQPFAATESLNQGFAALASAYVIRLEFKGKKSESGEALFAQCMMYLRDNGAGKRITKILESDLEYLNTNKKLAHHRQRLRPMLEAALDAVRARPEPQDTRSLLKELTPSQTAVLKTRVIDLAEALTVAAEQKLSCQGQLVATDT